MFAVTRSFDLADRGYLIETGRIVGSGSGAASKVDPAVQHAYLGAGEVHAGARRVSQSDTDVRE